MNVLYLLVGLNSVILIFLVVNVFKPFIGSYAAKKGENLATKEDIAQLTKIAERIRAKISDEYWDRQKQWEMRRDTLYEAVRVLTGYNGALTGLHLAYSVIDHEDSGKNAARNKLIVEKYLQYLQCCSDFHCAISILDMVVGGKVSSDFRNYYEFAQSLVENQPKDKNFLDDEIGKELRRKLDFFVQSARGALGINDAGETMPLHSADAS
jgi:hypothetical protein